MSVLSNTKIEEKAEVALVSDISALIIEWYFIQSNMIFAVRGNNLRTNIHMGESTASPYDTGLQLVVPLYFQDGQYCRQPNFHTRKHLS